MINIPNLALLHNPLRVFNLALHFNWLCKIMLIITDSTLFKSYFNILATSLLPLMSALIQWQSHRPSWAWKERPGSDYDWACQHTLLIAATRIPLNHYATRAQKSVCMSGEISWVEPESWDTVIFSPLLARVPQRISCISVCDSSVTHLPRFFLKHMDLFSALCKSMRMHTSELTTPPWPNCLYWSCKFDESDLLNH